MLKLICALICFWSCTMVALAAPITTGQIVLKDTQRKTSPCDGDPDEALKEYARKEQAEDNAFGLSFDLEAFLQEIEEEEEQEAKDDTVFLELEDTWPFEEEAQRTELEAALLALLWPEQEEDPLDFCSDT
ncbi:hypothetical protein J3Q64DRAFT_1704092 [Phycomyces blakesleeanus]|uniref:Uncharacterized protein n=2 Tax=Phycomyces blakesleeanus TaxID=4837 RepID=A0A163AAJ4_PHYB8|nr:hypothetical protein PHYBLDRAFT_71250 [Phycomyces blakesleeanus NRRL 1555(-)]OAD72161.1 hypothetical protein PHYBLDRAFT_71250 [Phycomyces blakesleeanus NRRL 1555(-)]|eukprot:XP_018290201.1 hypothetical protein PHYBLDRAFT_71250 [Phycomyces blakesleeanus NRRL 1555(-)]